MNRCIAAFLSALFLVFFQDLGASPAVQDGSDTLRFAFLTDLHYSKGSLSAKDLSRCVKDVNAQEGLDFVLIGGDLTDFGSDDEIAFVKKMLDSLEYDYHVVAGNHDAKWSESGCNTFREVFGYDHFDFTVKGWRFLGCNCGPDMRMAPALLPRESMEWLGSLEPYEKTIFINHYPQDSSVLNYFDVTRELKRLGTRFVIGGHWHSNNALDYDGLPGVLCRSTLSAGTNPGYCMVEITGDKVTVSERRLYGDTPVLFEPWFSAELAKVEDNVEYDAHGLPASYPWMRYDVNDDASSKGVVALWEFHEDSNIAAGFARSGDMAWYATTAGSVRCISLKDGHRIWSASFPGRIFSTPAVSGRTLVFGCADGFVYALDSRDGSVKWKHRAEKSVLSSPVIMDGKVFIGASDGCFRALDLRDGSVEWEYRDVEGFVECRPYVDDTQVVFGTWGNKLYSLDPRDGSLQWVWKCERTSRMFSPAAVWPVKSDGRIFIAVPDRSLYVLDADDGHEIKRFERSARESVGISPDGNTVYCKSMWHTMTAIDAGTLDVEWKVETGTGYDISPTSISRIGNEVLMPTDKGNIVSFSAKDGSRLWARKISNALVNPMEVWNTHEGHFILASTMDGAVTLIKSAIK
ncbi:MAG: PQQ-binding-like beta-propeller repeat protein [Bacteroidales bacterium]|nr:PQQ-binding-like beta-propeller repeat protein [Bacteroidales bacterium]